MALLLFRGMMLVFFLFAGTGCLSHCPVTRLSLHVQVEPSCYQAYPGRPITVDVVGVPLDLQPRWESYSMTRYWQPSDPQRHSLPTLTMTFEPGSLTPQWISTEDPIWKKWLAGTTDKRPPLIFVLVQYPRTFDAAREDRDGREDPRRVILPTGACRWHVGVMGPAPYAKLVVSADRIRTAAPFD